MFHISTCPCQALDEKHKPSGVSLFSLRAALLIVSICMFPPILVRWESCTSCVTVCAKCSLGRKSPVLLQKSCSSKRSCVMLFVCSFMHIYSYQKCPCYVYIPLHSKNIEYFSHCLKIHCRIWNFWWYPIIDIISVFTKLKIGDEGINFHFLTYRSVWIPQLRLHELSRY